MHYTIPTLYRTEALPIVRAFGEALLTEPVEKVTIAYRQVNGVRLDLTNQGQGIVVLSQADFEALLNIFEGDTFGARIRAQWEIGIPNEAYYDQLIQQAVEAAFPAYP